MLERSVYGAVIFDDESKPTSGWASVRGRAAFRIRGTGDLASDIYWWTNLPAETFVRYGQLGNRKLKRLEYLKPNMTQLHQELGLTTVKAPLSKIAEVTSEIFDRVMRLAAKNYGLQYPVELTLSEDLFDLLVKEDKSITPEIDDALRLSYQTWSRTPDGGPEKSKIVTFRRPRLIHARDVLTTPIPGEQWEFVEGRRLPSESKRVDWLIAQGRPVLARAAVKKVHFEYSRVVTFGADPRDRVDPRSWMSHPELLMFAKFGEVRVDAVFLGNEYTPQQVNKHVFTGGALGSISISTGILAENYWIALASSRSHKRFSRDAVTIHSPRAVWMAATDRFHSVLPALMLGGSGFSVRGYGRGKVTVAVPRGALGDLRSCAAAAGLDCPLSVHDEIAVQSALA